MTTTNREHLMTEQRPKERAAIRKAADRVIAALAKGRQSDIRFACLSYLKAERPGEVGNARQIRDEALAAASEQLLPEGFDTAELGRQLLNNIICAMAFGVEEHGSREAALEVGRTAAARTIEKACS